MAGSPSESLATLRPDLAESFMEFDLEMEKAGYIANQVFPVVDVAEQAGNFGLIPLEELLAESETKRGTNGEYNRDDFEFEDAQYSCEEHGFESRVDKRLARMHHNYFDAELIAAARAHGKVLRNAEKRVADAVFNTTTWTGSSLTTAVSNEWDDSTNATPIADVEAAVQKVYDGTGLWPNALVINYKVFRNLRNVAEIIDRINSDGAGDQTRAADITKSQLSQVFDLPYIFVAKSSRNSANRGQTASPAQIWSGEYAMVCKVATSNDFQEACIGRTFHWSGDGSSLDGTVEQYYEESKRSDFIRYRHDVDEIVLLPAAGHLLSNITT